MPLWVDSDERNVQLAMTFDCFNSCSLYWFVSFCRITKQKSVSGAPTVKASKWRNYLTSSTVASVRILRRADFENPRKPSNGIHARKQAKRNLASSHKPSKKAAFSLPSTINVYKEILWLQIDTMSASRIEYSEKYADDDHEYRYVNPWNVWEFTSEGAVIRQHLLTFTKVANDIRMRRHWWKIWSDATFFLFLLSQINLL